jgi:hypothetical protein
MSEVFLWLISSASCLEFDHDIQQAVRQQPVQGQEYKTFAGEE